MKPLRIFIGFDSREAVAYHVLSHSILKRASGTVSITPLVQSALRSEGVYRRERGPTEATEFSMTRFLTPYLAGYDGLAVFMDSDMLVKCDIHELIAETIVYRKGCAVWVCKHDYTPKSATKMEGQPQTTYPRKNWSSFMVFDCGRCRSLTPHAVNDATGLFLHRFQWLKDEEIGSLPLEYNYLVGEYPKNPDAKIVHFTEGGPWFRNYQDVDYADEWIREHGEIVPRVTWSREAWLNSDLVAQ